MAEWLGTGLQNPLQRFESASDLKPKGSHFVRSFFCTLKPRQAIPIACKWAEGTKKNLCFSKDLGLSATSQSGS